jgi:hypothetical protein
MVIDSVIRKKRLRSGLTALALGSLIVIGGCASRPPPPGGDLLVPLAAPAPWLPEPSDKVAARAVAAALASDAATLKSAVAELNTISDSHKGADLDALAADLLHSTLDDPEAYRVASEKLTAGWNTDPALDARLQMAIDDDLLALAWRRRRDTWENYWARTFNAVSQPLGQALFNGFVLAPLQISTSVAHYLASFSNDEALPATDRQALALRKEYLARNPTADDAAFVEGQVAGADAKLAKTMRTRRLRTARAAEKSGRYRVAGMEARRALFWGPSPEAEKILAHSKARNAEHHRLFERSLEATPEPPGGRYTASSRQLAIALLRSSGASQPLDPDLLETLERESRGTGYASGQAAYVFALAQYEAGKENSSWKTLKALAGQSPAENGMVRHAAHLIADAWQHPYLAYRDARARSRNKTLRWRLFGQYATANRYPNLPRSLGLLLESPGIATALATSPIRLIFGRWQPDPDFQRASAMLAYRYLGLHPSGQHSEELVAWLFDYETSRDNSVAALRLADFLPAMSDAKRAELAEAASAQQLSGAERIKRPDRRIQALRFTSMEYPDNAAGRLAGLRVRAELEDASPQKITITKDFLVENPRVAGPAGLGLNPILINGEVEDGELHPMGITLLGGLTLRFDLIGEDGKEKSPPAPLYKQISAERMAQLAAMLDETTRRNELIDPGDRLVPDADRDQFIERALLGLADRPDKRPTAQSTYVYQSMRERYGIVRGRESILPFDLVLQGSFSDLNLGAFPRWRPPKETPDIFLYR